MNFHSTRRPRPWLILALSVFAQASATVLVSTPAFLIPLLHAERRLSLAAAGTLAAAAALVTTDILGGWSVAPLLIIASIVTVADNGLAYTAVAELAGPAWSGRALGAQNTGQFPATFAVGPVVGALIGVAGYPIAFAVVALAPLVAVPLVPMRTTRSRWDAETVTSPA